MQRLADQFQQFLVQGQGRCGERSHEDGGVELVFVDEAQRYPMRRRRRGARPQHLLYAQDQRCAELSGDAVALLAQQACAAVDREADLLGFAAHAAVGRSFVGEGFLGAGVSAAAQRRGRVAYALQQRDFRGGGGEIVLDVGNARVFHADLRIGKRTASITSSWRGQRCARRCS
ncbi:hypothetical protein ACFJIW_06405 [Tahibacter sp. UC22_41]|uniref:hypothetical protein n=1 Tax=Tahibacter sp. UC22_41 TaxID=3350178 RepID=UPI0036DD2592